MSNNTIAIVVDTDVVRAASESSINKHARLCAEILNIISKQKIFILALSPQLQQEYFRIRPNTSEGGWRYYISLHAFGVLKELKDRNRINIYDIDDDLEKKILNSLDPSTHQRAKKDLPVLLTALSADNRLISNNRRERELFQRACKKISELRSLLWPDPMDQVPEWLRKDAPDIPHHRLCHNTSLT
ncbi:MAG: hypothetical protein L3J76_01080 [Candidatus Hydrothermae bacterium]|nr:hypothetical protein [Candidatus Hydrothermae bacterium]